MALSKDFRQTFTDNLGRTVLERKTLSSSQTADTLTATAAAGIVTDTYDIRSQMLTRTAKKSSTTLFSETLRYDSPTRGTTARYAGDLTYAVTVSGGNTTYALESAEASVDGTARFLKNGTAMTPYYTIKDHLGSVRTIVNASGTVQERNDYYPFGQRTN